MQQKFKLRPRDILRIDGDGPCEVIAAFDRPRGQMLFSVNKRTLEGSWNLSCDVEFVRRPGANIDPRTVNI